MKALTFVLLTTIILSALMLIRGTEPQPSGPELFTLRRDNFYEVRFAHVHRSEPTPIISSAIAKRQHFGFPCYAVIADKSHAGNLYAKLDLIRFTANFLSAALASFALLFFFQFFRRSHTKDLMA